MNLSMGLGLNSRRSAGANQGQALRDAADFMFYGDDLADGTPTTWTDRNAAAAATLVGSPSVSGGVVSLTTTSHVNLPAAASPTTLTATSGEFTGMLRLALPAAFDATKILMHFGAGAYGGPQITMSVGKRTYFLMSGNAGTSTGYIDGIVEGETSTIFIRKGAGATSTTGWASFGTPAAVTGTAVGTPAWAPNGRINGYAYTTTSRGAWNLSRIGIWHDRLLTDEECALAAA